MKLFISLIIMVFSITSFAQMPQRPPARGGDRVGNGGDGYVGSLIAVARAYHRVLLSLPESERMGIDPAKFIEVVDTFSITSSPEVLILNGEPKDIINYPLERSMEISRPRVDALPIYLHDRLYLHEILGAMNDPNINDSKYKYSDALLARGSGLVSFPTVDSLSPDDYKSWCNNVAETLNFALKTGLLSPTREGEKSILLSGIDQALALGKEKERRFFASTLRAALADIGWISQEPSRQVFFLRYQIQSALIDLETFDPMQVGKDYGPYLVSILSRGLGAARESTTYREESVILSRLTHRAIATLSQSDYLRTNRYGCVMNVLLQAANVADDRNLTDAAKVQVLRQLIQRAHDNFKICK